MKAVMLVALVFLAACTSAPQPVAIEPAQEATPERIQAALNDDITTFSLVWNQGWKQFIVTESAVSLIPNDIPRMDLLSKDANALKLFLKENRFDLLNATEFSAFSSPECRNGFLRATINGIGKTIPVAGCASISATYKELFEKLRELENKYYP